MARHFYHVKVQCKCGSWINVRYEGGTYGGSHTEPCWHCHRSVEVRGTTGYCENDKRPTQIISHEVKS